MKINNLLILILFFITFDLIKSKSKNEQAPIIKSCSYDSVSKKLVLNGNWENDKSSIHILFNNNIIKKRFDIWGKNDLFEDSEMVIYDVPIDSNGGFITLLYSNSGIKSNDCILTSKIDSIQFPDTKGGEVSIFGTFYFNSITQPTILFNNDKECKLQFDKSSVSELICKIKSGWGCFSTITIDNVFGFNSNNIIKKINCYQDPMILNVEIDQNEPNKAIVEGHSFWPTNEIILTVNSNENGKTCDSNNENCLPVLGKDLKPISIEKVNDNTFIMEFDQALQNISHIDIKYKKFYNLSSDHPLYNEIIEQRRYLH